ncbi:MAG: hypothetical protein LBD23_01300 [Oscillospiraceae bacterium]|nr:hypothetical protein [Oscillospiraceae bacterium]
MVLVAITAMLNVCFFLLFVKELLTTISQSGIVYIDRRYNVLCYIGRWCIMWKI